jgi:hypothetical protein
VTLAAACTQPRRPDDTTLYEIALDAARTQLELAQPIPLHPFPLLLPRGAQLRRVSELDFNAFDSTTVPAIVRAAPTRYELCTIDRAGSCAVEEAGIALVLSNLLPVERDAVGMILVVVDGGGGSAVERRYYAVRIKHSLGRWEVVEFERL